MGYGVNSPGIGRTNRKSGTYNTVNRKRERSGAGLKKARASKACGVKRKGRSCKKTRQLRKVSICVTIRLSKASWEIRDAGIRRVPEGAGAAAWARLAGGIAAAQGGRIRAVQVRAAAARGFPALGVRKVLGVLKARQGQEVCKALWVHKVPRDCKALPALWVRG